LRASWQEAKHPAQSCRSPKRHCCCKK
jgi:hypothetical protein